MKDNDVRLTPPELFAELQDLYGHPFQLDVCATHANAKCWRYYTTTGLFEGGLGHGPLGHDGLTGPWVDHWYANPPYSDIEPWVVKAWSEGKPGLMVVPASKTEQGWWQCFIEYHRDRADGHSINGLRLETRFLKGRRRFLNEDGQPIYARNKDGSVKVSKKTGKPVLGSPKWGLVALVWRRVL